MDRLRYEKEIEQLEENWKKESTELLSMISRLQDDNRKLSSSLKEREEQNVPKSTPRPGFVAILGYLIFLEGFLEFCDILWNSIA